MRVSRFDSAISRFGRSLRTTLPLGICFAVGSTQALSAQDLAIVDAKIYPSPRAAALEHGTVLIQNGLIVAVGPRDDVHVPESVPIVEGTGKVIVAGFWNSHVHFTEPVWANAATAPADALEEHMQAMLTRWGFMTVFDIASNPIDTFALRQRVDHGEVPGPRIFTTGAPLYPENGIPMYVPKETAKLIERFQADSPATATRLAKEMISLGIDGIKVFSGSIILENGHYGVRPMPTEIIRAAVNVAHAAGKPVFAHPSNRVGADHALAGGVDILAHTLSLDSSLSEEELREMKQNHVALIPTLSLFPDEVRKSGGGPAVQQEVLQHCIEQLRAYFRRGGTILFGTDVGYTPLYDTTNEYEYMGRSGMTWRDILASLTTTPAKFFKVANTGEVRKGEAGDLVVLDADPADDVRNFARVAYTIRAGGIIYGKQG